MAAITTLVVFVVSLWLPSGRHVDQAHYSNGPNAVWSRHQWVGESHSEAEYDALADELRRNAITDAFFHVGPLEADGTIPAARYPNARELIKNLKARYPKLRPQAWIGQVLPEGGGPLLLSDESVRRQIVETSKTFLDLGFSGIHYNLEPVPSGDQSFVDLLKRARAMTKAAGGILSISAEEPDPSGPAGDIARTLSNGYHAWDYSYYLEVIPLVDQMAVMAYDSGVPFDWLYTALVRRYTARLVTLVGGKVTLFMGVPTYEDRNLGHVPEVENISSSLAGIQQGLEGYSSAELRNFGVAIYAQWTTDEAEWAIYRRTWLGET